MKGASGVLGAILVVSFSLSLALGPLLHAITPHTHSLIKDGKYEHSHDSAPRGESALWTDLHATLNHEGKKLWDLALPLLLLFVFASLRESVSDRNLRLLFVRQGLIAGNLALASSLRRGTLSYRRFG